MSELPSFDLHPRTRWDARFFQLTDLIASWSEDTSRKVGAVIVGEDQEIRSIGFNGLPRGVSASFPERFSRDGGEKYLWFEHAERNAIFNAARFGAALNDCLIYSNLYPCADCMRAIIQSGIKELRTYSPPPGEDYYRRSFEVSSTMASEAGLTVRYYERV